MKYSKLKNEMEVLELKHKHQLAELQMNQNEEMRLLQRKCTHTYDDGTSARKSEGNQFDIYYVCKICNTTLG